MALVPCQVLRVAILLSYCSILCNYKAIEMPSHKTYGGSWKFLTFIDLVRPSPSPPRPLALRAPQPQGAQGALLVCTCTRPGPPSPLLHLLMASPGLPGLAPPRLHLLSHSPTPPQAHVLVAGSTREGEVGAPR